MANTLKFGAGQWATKEGSTLAYNDENNNFKPLPFNFERGSSATVVNKDGLIETVGNGEPRIDYKDDSKGALLLEPQRTNLITYSEDFSNWSSGSTYTTQGYAISPDGTQNASRLLFTGSGQNIYINTSATGDVVGSIYVKGTLGETIQLFVGGGETQFTLSGDWQRIVVEKTSSTNGFINVNTNGGSTARDLLVWGAQLEQGSYATSYIPTQGSAVTRLADSCSQTVPDGVIGQTEGVVFMDFIAQNATGQSQSHFWLGASGNEIGLYGGGQFIFYSSGGVSINGGNIVTGQRYKVAFGYKANDYVAYVNGNQVGTDTSATVPTMSGLALNSYFNGTEVQKKNITDFKLYNTRLSNTELQALTQV